MIEWIVTYWMEFIFGIIATSITYGFKKKLRILETKLIEQENVKDGVQALLRNEIFKNYNEYMDKGYYPIYARSNVENMYNKYHDLGGNGTVTELVKKLNELPTGKEEE